MKTVEWEIEGLAEERIRREARQRNEAFRRRLEERKAARHQKTRLKLALAILVVLMAASLAWVFAGMPYLSG